jgi:hypothetical protein
VIGRFSKQQKLVVPKRRPPVVGITFPPKALGGADEAIEWSSNRLLQRKLITTAKTVSGHQRSFHDVRW